MGTAQSAAARTQRGSKKQRIYRLRQTQADIEDLEKQINAHKILLYRTQVDGMMKRDQRDEEIYDISTLTYKKRKVLMKKGRNASSAIPFEEYRRIARNPACKKQKSTKKDTHEKEEETPSTDISSKGTDKNGNHISSGDNGKATDKDPPPPIKQPNGVIANKPSRFSRAVMALPRSLPLANTVFSYLEAYLLKRLHMAMLQEHQQQIHRNCWSDNVSSLFMEIEPLRTEAISVLTNLRHRVDAGLDRNRDIKKVYEDHLRYVS
mmetsp:Transcript_39097/g.94527  ORF Transcript_39097/g.94527 Transcript_39097/m.94527 type:complete len:264 (+) Transcript_39097:107-898(+)